MIHDLLEIAAAVSVGYLVPSVVAWIILGILALLGWDASEIEERCRWYLRKLIRGMRRLATRRKAQLGG